MRKAGWLRLINYNLILLDLEGNILAKANSLEDKLAYDCSHIKCVVFLISSA